ncbi:MAG: helix-hairpin-helix domain-containing protein [Candidatus Cloacimonetes bacterium]|nr:helix-hairpin-helix domain-containing protein [Candidatus Cloacimonadota bacterium]
MARINNFLRNYLTPTEQKIVFFILIAAIVGIVIHYSGLEAEDSLVDSLKVIASDPVPIRFDINTITEQELQVIPGIGPARAQAIIAYRETNKPIVVDDLLNVRGIGEVTLAKIKEFFGESNNRLESSEDESDEKTLNMGQRDFSSLMNINDASIEDLMAIRGVGQVRGESIFNYIREQGRIKNIDQLLDISGIGPKTLENIKELFYADDDR